MVRRILSLGLLGVWLVMGLGCGDGPCPDGYVEKDEHCVPEAIVSHCQFTGSSEAGESCAANEDCHGCFLVCLEQSCIVQLDGGLSCTRDLECKSGRCEASRCLDP